MQNFIEKLRRQWLRSAGNLLILAFFSAYVSGYINWGFIDHLEHLAYDARLALTMPNSFDPRIVIIDIDEKSLGVEGRWPWPRAKLARLVDTLFDDYGIAILGFDVVFAEPDESSGIGILEDLAKGPLHEDGQFQLKMDELRGTLDYDRRFAQSLEGRPVVLGYYFNDSSGKDEATISGQLPAPTFLPGQFTGRKIPFIRGAGYGANLPELQRAAYTAGHFNPFVDPDGIVRRVTMLYEFEGAHYESLSMAIARVALGVEKVEPVYAEHSRVGGDYAGLEWLKLDDRLIPVDERVRSLVPYRGRKGSFPYVPATDVLNKSVDASVLRDAIVLVGTTAPGLLDLRSAPIQNVFPGWRFTPT